MIDPSTVVVGVLPRVDRARFAEVLRQANSPAAAEADACYAAVARLGVDPLFALAVFRHESRYGTTGIVARYDLRNPGATRTSRTGEGGPVQIPGRGQFWRYPSWTAGFRDLGWRLVDPSFVYRQRQLRTIAEIVPVWAPAADGNDPRAYVEAVVNAMRELQQDLIGVPLRISFIPVGARNRPGYPLQPQWITVHETANENPGANAEAHRQFVHAGGGPEGVSFHFVVDDREVVQLLPLDENGWHAGDGPEGPGNRTSVALELCVNRDADWERTLRNAIALLVALCRALGLGPDRIVQHNRWSGKDCPRRLRSQNRWDWLLAQVRAQLAAAPTVVPVGPHGRHLGGGFLALWRQLEAVDPTLPLRLLGWPLTEEFSVDGATYQVCERATLKFAPSEPEPWRVHVALADEAQRVRAVARERGLLP